MTTHRKGPTMTEIIDFIARELEAALARGLTRDEARLHAEMQTRTTFAGERPYIAAWPKQKRAVQLARLEKLTTQQAVAATGLSRQHVWRLRRVSR